MKLKDIVKAIFDISAERNVDLIVSAAMFRDENKGVDTTEAEKYIQKHTEDLCEAYATKDEELWSECFPAEDDEVEAEDEPAETEAE